MATQASERTYPSALASSVLQRPSGASMAAPTNMAVVSQFMGTLTPQDRPEEQPLCSMAVCTKWVPTRDEEQAVSMLTDGPCLTNGPLERCGGGPHAHH